MRKLITIIGLLIVNISVAKEMRWTQGVIVLQNNEVLKGQVIVEMKHDLVVMKNDTSGVQVFPAHKIKQVRFFDSVANINRKFISIRLNESHVRKNSLFEVVLHGDVLVIRKQPLFFSDINDDGVGYKYFVYFNDKVFTLHQFRRNVYLKLKSSAELKMFVDRNKLSATFPSDILRIVEYHNMLLSNES